MGGPPHEIVPFSWPFASTDRAWPLHLQATVPVSTCYFVSRYRPKMRASIPVFR
jgi:hypothetical protein